MTTTTTTMNTTTHDQLLCALGRAAALAEVLALASEVRPLSADTVSAVAEMMTGELEAAHAAIGL